MTRVSTTEDDDRSVFIAIDEHGRHDAARIALFTELMPREVEQALQRLRRKGQIRFGRRPGFSTQPKQWMVCK